jgi:hypothetical protein
MNNFGDGISGVGGPTRERKQEPYGGQRVQEQAHCGDGD